MIMTFFPRKRDAEMGRQTFYPQQNIIDKLASSCLMENQSEDSSTEKVFAQCQLVHFGKLVIKATFDSLTPCDIFIQFQIIFHSNFF